MLTFKRIALSSAFVVSALAGCTPLVPRELADARAAYMRASAGPASTVVPAELHKARESLNLAEQSFADKPDAQITRDLSYVAERKAQMAEALAGQAIANKKKSSADNEYQADAAQIQKDTNGKLVQTREQLAASQRQVGADKRAIGEADQRTDDADQRAASAEKKVADANARLKSMEDALAKLAAVKEEQRGLVITLSGSVLFASDQSTLLPEAQTRLSQVSDALLSTKERNIVVEGFTDSKGSDSHNLDLSQRRADAVRAYIVSRGYESDRITAHGIGKDRPVATNANAEGRANNRRVEIVIQPLLASK